MAINRSPGTALLGVMIALFALAHPLSADTAGDLPDGADAAASDADAGTKGDEIDRTSLRVRAGGELAVWNTTLGTTGKENTGAYQELGMIGEYAANVRVQRGRHTHAEVRACYGCHGLEVEQAFFEYRPERGLFVRAGRLLLPMGNQSAYQSSLKTVSKPLTRAMGLMLRSREFNQGILPGPASDNGVAAGGSTDLASMGAKLSYQAFVVRGFKGAGADLNFISSRDYEDHNNEPGYGGRVEISGADAGIGFSYTGGVHDNRNGNLRYDIGFVDFRFTLGLLTVEGEAAARRMEYDVPGGESEEDNFTKSAVWLQATLALDDGVALVVSGDGMNVEGAYLGPGGISIAPNPTTTDDSNQVWRASLGMVFTTQDGIILKAVGEYWAFSDFKDSFVFQVGAVWKF